MASCAKRGNAVQKQRQRPGAPSMRAHSPQPGINACRSLRLELQIVEAIAAAIRFAKRWGGRDQEAACQLPGRQNPARSDLRSAASSAKVPHRSTNTPELSFAEKAQDEAKRLRMRTYEALTTNHPCESSLCHPHSAAFLSSTLYCGKIIMFTEQAAWSTCLLSCGVVFSPFPPDSCS